MTASRRLSRVSSNKEVLSSSVLNDNKINENAMADSEVKAQLRRRRFSSYGSGVEALKLVFRKLSYDSNFKSNKKKKGSKSKKIILDSMSGQFLPGRLTAIMGPSGAGKTSLLDVVAGNLMGGKISGDILINGVVCSKKKIKDISGFVFQDDVLLSTMTAREAIEMSATLRLPQTISKQERNELVDEIISLLNLQTCENTLIGSPLKKGISGGERKRVAIAMELIANPPMLFLDEPTSGLDTFTAYTVVNLLADMAHKQGRTVVATIHQPSSDIFNLFDDLILLQSGKVIYCGPAKDTVDYFTTLGFVCPEYCNPADFFFMNVLNNNLNNLKMDRIVVSTPPSPIEGAQNSVYENLENSRSFDQLYPSKKDGEKNLPGDSNSITNHSNSELANKWKHSREYEELCASMERFSNSGIATKSLRKKAPLKIQFTYLCKRASKNAYRNPMILILNFGVAIYLGLLVGIIYIDSKSLAVPSRVLNFSGALYFIIISQFFRSSLGTLNMFFAEKQVFYREHKSGYYSTTPYFFSKLLVEIPIYFLSPYLAVIIAYYMVGFDPAFSKYLMTATFAALVAVAALSMGMLISTAFEDYNVVLTVAPLILLPLFLFSGILVNSNELPVYFNWIKYISPPYYAYTGTMETQFSGPFPNCDSVRDNYPCNGDQILKLLGVATTFSIGVNVVFIILLWFSFTMAAYLVLVIKTRLRFKST